MILGFRKFTCTMLKKLASGRLTKIRRYNGHCFIDNAYLTITSMTSVLPKHLGQT